MIIQVQSVPNVITPVKHVLEQVEEPVKHVAVLTIERIIQAHVSVWLVTTIAEHRLVQPAI